MFPFDLSDLRTVVIVVIVAATGAGIDLACSRRGRHARPRGRSLVRAALPVVGSSSFMVLAVVLACFAGAWI